MNIQSVDRAIRILFAFTVEERLLGVSELSEKLNLNQSTVHHLASSLRQWGLLEQDPVSKKYQLGVRLIELGGTMLQSRSVARAIQPYLHHVADYLKETAYLGILRGADLLNLEQAYGPHLIQSAGWQGRRTPFYCTSAGKVLAAYLPDETLDRLIAENTLTPYTPLTIIDPQALRENLAEVRAQGYAISFAEMDEQISAVAVPIKGLAPDSGQVVAAIGVAGPTYRFTRESCEESVGFLKSVAQEVATKVNTEDLRYINNT